MNKEKSNPSTKRKKLQYRQYIAMAFMMLIGAVCGVIMAKYIDDISPDATFLEGIPALIGLFLGMFAALFFHMILHETGHLIFGLLTGYRFSSFRIFSFMWVKENGRLRLKRLSLAGTGGQCLMAPPDLKDGRIPFVLYNLGGAFINIIVGTLFLAGYLLCPDAPFLSPLLLIFAVVGYMTALLNGIPMRMGSVDNDGYNAYALSKNPEAIESFWVQLKIAELTSKGVRLKDMPSQWFAVPSDEAMKNSITATRGVFACNRLMDAGKFEEAGALIDHLLKIDSGIIGLHHDLLICDRIYMELIRENRPEVIEQMLTKEQRKFMKGMKRFPSVLRTEYALALVHEKDPAKAEAIQSEFEKTAKTYPYPHEIEAERELMNLL